MGEIVEKTGLGDPLYRHLKSVTLDGRPLLDETETKRSPDPYDPRATTKYDEAFAAATVACLVGLTSVQISSEDAEGRPRETPDLLLTSDQHGTVGVEVRRVDESAAARVRLYSAQKMIAEFLRAHPEFKANLRFTLEYAKTGLLSTSDATKLAEEVIDCLKSGRIAMLPNGRHETVFTEGTIAHRSGMVVEINRPTYATLLGFTKADEMTPFEGFMDAIEVKRKLKYKCDYPLWLVVVATDPRGPFVKAVQSVRDANPSIDPFSKAFVHDGMGFVVILENPKQSGTI